MSVSRPPKAECRIGYTRRDAPLTEYGKSLGLSDPPDWNCNGEDPDKCACNRAEKCACPCHMPVDSTSPPSTPGEREP